jgi:SAM-dependent methyltransferase
MMPPMYDRSADLYDLVYSFKDYEGEAKRVDELIRQTRPEARTLLDVACGTGSHLVHLGARYEVEGLDLEPALLEVAKTKLPDTRLHLDDMTSFDLGRTFDAVTCLFSAIGHAGTEDALRAAIQCMSDHLEPGGVLIVEPWLQPDAFIPGYLTMTIVDEPDIKLVRMERSHAEGQVSVLDFHYVINRPEGITQFTEQHRPTMFSRGQQERAFEDAGLSVDYHERGLMGRGLFVGRKR